MTGNNEKIQEFSTKYVTINLTVLFAFENTPSMKEAVLCSLLAFLKATNFPAKRQFVTEFDGVNQLCRWVCIKGEEEKAQYGQGAQLRKI